MPPEPPTPDDAPPPFGFDAFPALQTPRLRLREVTPADGPALFALRGDPEVTALNIGAAYREPSQGEDLAAHIRRAWRARQEIWWALVPTDADANADALIGLVILYRLRPGPAAADPSATLGYEMARSHWGRGLMTEAVHAALGWGFDRLGLSRVDADADARNARSERLLRRVGFVPGGLRREIRRPGDAPHDLRLYALSRGSWYARGDGEAGGGRGGGET